MIRERYRCACGGCCCCCGGGFCGVLLPLCRRRRLWDRSGPRLCHCLRPACTSSGIYRLAAPSTCRRRAAEVARVHGKLTCLMINDLDAGIGHFENTQLTVNNQVVVGTLMNLCDNPNRVSTGQDWIEGDSIRRVPIIVTGVGALEGQGDELLPWLTCPGWLCCALLFKLASAPATNAPAHRHLPALPAGNDFSRIFAPLVRDGRMEKYYWQPTEEDLVGILFQASRRERFQPPNRLVRTAHNIVNTDLCAELICAVLVLPAAAAADDSCRCTRMTG